MLKIFPIDFVRQILEQKLKEEHIKNVNYYGGKQQVAITSFYEQLRTQDEVDRFVETYRDLSEQQNRTGLILNGVLVSPENPTITNLYSSLIIPMSWTCSMRCTLENRDSALITINNLIEKLKGRKVDVAQLDSRDSFGKPIALPFCVGTLGQNDGDPLIKNGDFIGAITNVSQVPTILNNLSQKGLQESQDLYWLYVENSNKLKVVTRVDNYVNGVSFVDTPTIEDEQDIYVDVQLDGVYSESDIGTISADVSVYGDTTVVLHLAGEIESKVDENNVTTLSLHFHAEHQLGSYVNDYTDFAISNVSVLVNKKHWVFSSADGTNKDIIYPQEHTSFEKFKVSLSFDSVRCDEPRNLNEQEYCEISFGGSATLVSDGVQLGNDLLKVSVSKRGINAQTPIDFAVDGVYPSWWLEPLELPSGSNADTQLNQLMSNHFINNSHTDALSLTLQYTFIYDKNISLLKQLFNYARYGTQGSTSNDISPNMIFGIVEIWSSWGVFEPNYVKAKIVENIDIENTESDTLTISVTMQIQGEND